MGRVRRVRSVLTAVSEPPRTTARATSEAVDMVADILVHECVASKRCA